MTVNFIIKLAQNVVVFSDQFRASRYSFGQAGSSWEMFEFLDYICGTSCVADQT